MSTCLEDKINHVVENYTPEEILKAHKEATENDPIGELISKELLSIKTKTAELIRLRCNRAQRHFLDTISKIRQSGKPIRIWVLKARQEGISIAVETKVIVRDSLIDKPRVKRIKALDDTPVTEMLATRID